MTDEEIKTFQMALRIVGLEVDSAAIDLFLQVKEYYDIRGVDFDLMDACEIKANLYKKYGSGKTIMVTMTLQD